MFLLKVEVSVKMADVETNLAIQIDSNNTNTNNNDNSNYKKFNADEHVRTENDPIEESKTNGTNATNELEAPHISATDLRAELARRKSEAKGKKSLANS